MKQIATKNLKRSFTAARDDAGVPQVEADDWLGALYALGFMHGTDRLTQLLFARSVASGCAAEDIAHSPEIVETDRFFLRAGLHLDLEKEVALLDPFTREQLEAYCEGVNTVIEAGGRSWPMWATGYKPQLWDPEAVILVGKLLSFGGLAISQMQNERLLLELIHAGGSEQGLRELLRPRLDDVDFDLLRSVHMSSRLSDEALEMLTDLPRLAGSNAWALRPERSATGHALLASDPHLEVNRLPSIWYEAVLRWEGKYVMGATLPGCPLFAVARTPRLAWGVTYMKGDTIDFMIEDCRRGGETGWQYRRGETWLDFRRREETIHGKGSEPIACPIFENDQGTLETNPDEMGAGYHLSLAWSGKHPSSSRAIGTWLNVVHSYSAIEGMDAVRECSQPTLCFVFADRDGNIGLQACGRFPKRGGGYSGLTPIPAWDTENHWQGWYPQEKLPRIYNPPEGFVSTANEEMNPDDGMLLVTQILPDYRKRRIDERLHALTQATINDMQALQYDLVSLQARELLEVFLPHLPAGEMKERLTKWDCRYDPDSREAALFQRLYRCVLVEVFGHEAGIGWRRMVYLVTRAGYSTMVLIGADRLLQAEESFWWRERGKGALIRKAAEAAANMPDRTWKDVNNFHFTDRFFGNHQVGRMLGYNSRQYPMPGNHATPFQGHVLQTATRETTFAPSYHFVCDLGADEAWSNLPGGPSENRFSKYYRIDVARWFAGEYKRLRIFPTNKHSESSDPANDA